MANVGWTIVASCLYLISVIFLFVFLYDDVGKIGFSLLLINLFVHAGCCVALWLLHPSSIIMRVFLWITFAIFAIIAIIANARGASRLNEMGVFKPASIHNLVTGALLIALAAVLLLVMLRPYMVTLWIFRVILFLIGSITGVSMLIPSIKNVVASRNRNDNEGMVSRPAATQFAAGIFFLALSSAIILIPVHTISNPTVADPSIFLRFLVGLLRITLLVACPVLVLLGISDFNSWAVKKPYLKTMAGFASAGIAWALSMVVVRTSFTYGWVLYAVLVAMFVILLPVGISHFVKHDTKPGLFMTVMSVGFATLSFLVLHYWLNAVAGVIRAVLFAFFLIFGLGGLTLFCSGLFRTLRASYMDRGVNLIMLFGGLVVTVIDYLIGLFGLHLEWIRIDSFFNPFVVLPLVTIIAGVLLGLLLNWSTRVSYVDGSKTVATHEWRTSGTNQKYRDATVRDVYEKEHGSGSWSRGIQSSNRFFRVVSVLASAFGFGVVLLKTNLTQTVRVFQITIADYDLYSFGVKMLLCAILLLVAGLVAFLMDALSQ